MIEITGGFASRLAAFRDSCSALAPASGLFWYNPLDYAWEAHLSYQGRALAGKPRVLFLGMNPGPFGMVQTGVPFGAKSAVRDYLGITGGVGRPEREHPKRPIEGFSIKREEPSGTRFWAMVESVFPSADDFFSSCTVQNFCPLAFLDEGGRNVTPAQLPKKVMADLDGLCLDFLSSMLSGMGIGTGVGIGKYAEARLREAGCPEVIGISHPSPANPNSSKVWANGAGEIVEILRKAGVFHADN